MRQLNINVTPEFERDLNLYMKRRKLRTKSDALRLALHEAVRADVSAESYDFRQLLGLGLKAPLAKKRRFLTEDDLWS